MCAQALTSRTGALLFYLAILAGSLSLNVILGWRLRGLGEPSQAKMRSGHLLGKPIPVISVSSLDGTQASLQYAVGRPTVLYIFNSACRWCEWNVESVRALARQAGSAYRFIGLTDTSSRLSSSDSGLGFPVYVSAQTSTITRATPTTLLVSAGGIVIQEWPGAYIGDVQTEIEKLFHARLPAVSTKAPRGHRP